MRGEERSSRVGSHPVDLTAFREALARTYDLLPRHGNVEHFCWDDLWNDWAQACWEMFVERSLPPGWFLEIYGSGADINGASSRFCLPDVLPTHRVVPVAKNGDWLLDRLDGKTHLAGDFEFDAFVTASDDGWFETKPPFDMLHGFVDERTVLVSVDDVSFVVVPI